MTLRHQCSLNGCYKERLPDWGILDGCFPRGIRPSDVDGIVELNEHVLMLEWKPRFGSLTRGQLFMFQNMTRGSPKVQVLVIYGDKDTPAEIELYQNGTSRFRQACDVEFLRWFCQQWGLFAESRSKHSFNGGQHQERRIGPRRAVAMGTPTQLLLQPNTRVIPDRRYSAVDLNHRA